MNNLTKFNAKYIYLLILTLLALIPQFYIRRNLDVLNVFYSHFTTYYGDLWYCWDNYFAKNFPYPREYPSGIQAVYRLLFMIDGTHFDYSIYIRWISGVLAICAIVISWLLYRISGNFSKILCFWVFTPSFLFYGLYNLDFLCILTIVVMYYFFVQGRLVLSSLFLALGITIKVFPIFLLPVLFFSCKKKSRVYFWGSLLLFWLLMNVPFMLNDWNAWVFPFIWQIQENFARTAHDGSWTWSIYVLFDYFGFGSLSGKASLLLFASAYFCFIRKYWHLPLSTKLLGVMLLFILTDRVYSPQYNLYILPFLVLVNYVPNRKYFYLLEIANLIQCFFLFYIKDHVIYLQCILFIKYICLIVLFIQNWQASILYNSYTTKRAK